MSKNLSVINYQDNKEKLQKSPLKDVKAFLLKKKKESNNIVIIHTKISDKMKNNLVDYRKNIRKKRPIVIKKKLFLFGKILGLTLVSGLREMCEQV